MRAHAHASSNACAARGIRSWWEPEPVAQQENRLVIGPVSRSLVVVCVLCLVASISGSADEGAKASNDFPVHATVAASDLLTLWTEPGGDEVATKLAPGTRVEVIAGPNADGWYRIEAVDLPEAQRGWVPAEAIAIDQYVRAASNLRLYSAPSDSAVVVTKVRRGIVLAVVGPSEGDFLEVRYGDVAGYAFASELVAASGPVTDPEGERWVDVDRSSRKVRLMIGETVVDTFQAALGRDKGEGFYATASGTYRVHSKVAELSYTPYAGAYIMYWAGFDPARDNGFHSWTMDARGNVIKGGSGPTGGCVATRPEEAAIIYDFVEIGTRVEVHR
jgi:hypothetical protein